MKIAIITNDFPPKNVGGQGEILYSVYKSLKKLGHTVYVFNTFNRDIKNNIIDNLIIGKSRPIREHIKALKILLKPNNFKILLKFIKKYVKNLDSSIYEDWKRFKVPFRVFLNTFNAAENILPYFKKIDFDIMISGYIGLGEIICYILKQKTHKKMVSFCHGNDFLVKKPWKTVCMKESDGFIISTSIMKKEIFKRYGVPKDKIYVLPFGIRVEDYNFKLNKKNVRKELKIDEKEFIIISLGRLVYRKGFDIVIEVLSQLKQENKINNFKYIIAGDGSERKKLEKLTKSLNLTEQVIFLGRISNDMRDKYYKASDIFIMTSRKETSKEVEGFGVVYLEANLFGLPIIAARTGGTPEAVESNVNYIIQPENKEELKEKILFLYNNKEVREKNSELAIERILKNFTWDKKIIKYAEAIEDILKK
ncbi:MAG: glycosyltransferase family 4 protein [Promethearchaeota archaeon]